MVAHEYVREDLETARAQIAEILVTIRHEAAEACAEGDEDKFKELDAKRAQIEAILDELDDLLRRWCSLWQPRETSEQDELDPVERLIARIESAAEFDFTLPGPAQDDLPGGTAVHEGTRARETKGLPEREFIFPILEALTELGGGGTTREVLRRVYRKLQDRLTPEDHQTVPSGKQQRWRNKARWVRNGLVGTGFMSQHSPRGWWEITDRGRQALKTGDPDAIWRILSQYKQRSRKR